MTSEETQISEELKGCYENLIVIDIGANLTNKKYGRDLDSVIQRAKDAGNVHARCIKKIFRAKIACISAMNYTVLYYSRHSLLPAQLIHI